MAARFCEDLVDADGLPSGIWRRWKDRTLFISQGPRVQAQPCRTCSRNRTTVRGRPAAPGLARGPLGAGGERQHQKERGEPSLPRHHFLLRVRSRDDLRQPAVELGQI